MAVRSESRVLDNNGHSVRRTRYLGAAYRATVCGIICNRTTDPLSQLTPASFSDRIYRTYTSNIPRSTKSALLSSEMSLSTAPPPATTSTRSLWRYRDSPNTSLPFVPLPLSQPRISRASSQFSKILGLPDDITNFWPQEFWTNFRSGIVGGKGAEIDGCGDKALGTGELVVAIVGDFYRQKVMQRTLPWYASVSSHIRLSLTAASFLPHFSILQPVMQLRMICLQ